MLRPLAILMLCISHTFAENMATPEHRIYECQQLPDDVPPIETLAARAKLHLTQSWLAEQSPAFRPGTVSAGWTRTHLYIYAELEDDDIYNTADALNQPVGQLGDIFEILLRASGGERYFEFQVTPHRQFLQLRYPSAQSIADFRQSGGPIEKLIADFAIPTPILETETHIDPAQKRWTVLVKIPASEIVGPWGFRESDTLHASFCRYDRTRGSDTPVLSSTSPYPACDFHRQQEWGTLLLTH